MTLNDEAKKLNELCMKARDLPCNVYIDESTTVLDRFKAIIEENGLSSYYRVLHEPLSTQLLDDPDGYGRIDFSDWDSNRCRVVYSSGESEEMDEDIVLERSELMELAWMCRLCGTYHSPDILEYEEKLVEGRELSDLRFDSESYITFMIGYRIAHTYDLDLQAFPWWF